MRWRLGRTGRHSSPGSAMSQPLPPTIESTVAPTIDWREASATCRSRRPHVIASTTDDRDRPGGCALRPAADAAPPRLKRSSWPCDRVARKRQHSGWRCGDLRLPLVRGSGGQRFICGTRLGCASPAFISDASSWAGVIVRGSAGRRLLLLAESGRSRQGWSGPSASRGLA